MLVTPQSIGVYAGIESMIRGIMSSREGWQLPMPGVETCALPRSLPLVIAGNGGGLSSLWSGGNKLYLSTCSLDENTIASEEIQGIEELIAARREGFITR